MRFARVLRASAHGFGPSSPTWPFPKPARKHIVAAQIFGVGAWSWIMWRFHHNGDHLIQAIKREIFGHDVYGTGRKNGPPEHWQGEGPRRIA